MVWSRQIAIRWTVLLVVGAMLFYLPTREFLKATFLLGMPFILVLGYMVKKRRYSVPYMVCLVLLVFIACGYGFMLYTLPERVEARRIVMEGSALVGQGRYGEAIERYRGLEALGRTDDMQERIAHAEKEAWAAQLLSRAEALNQSGQREQALDLLEAIPNGTRASGQAKKLIKEWGG
ncbi:MAG: hypothetical protein ACOX0F_03465 [Syntrophomonadaceae bacterium]|jgi:hypothetical protein